jgi:tetratricopeptide (TPR) repeat protein
LAIAWLGAIDGRLSTRTRPWLAGILALLFAVLALGSESYAEVFAGPEALWAYVIAHNPDSWLAQNNLGVVDMETDRIPAAIAQFQKALALRPNSVDARTNLGFAYELTNRSQDALEQYEETLRINPNYGITQFHMGQLLEKMGQIPGAISHYQQALLINPADIGSRDALNRLKNGKATESE